MSMKQQQAFQLGVQLKRVGLYEEAWEAFERAKTQLKTHQASLVISVQVDMLLEMGHLAIKMGWLDSARRELNEALSLIESTTEVDMPRRASILFGLGCVHHHREEHEKARSLLFYVLEMQKDLAPKGSVEMARTVHLLAEHYRATGQAADAQQMYEAALLMLSSLVGKTDPDYLATEHDFAHHLAQSGHLEESAERLRRIVMQRETTLGATHPDVIDSLRLLAEIYTHQKCFTEADETFQRAMTLCGAGDRV